MSGSLREQVNDAALIGTACHAGAAMALESVMDSIGPDFNRCLALVESTLEEGWKSPDLHNVMIRGYSEALDLASGAFRAWWGTFLDQFDPEDIAGVERQFDVEAFWSPGRRVYLQGTMDVLMADGSVVDWKFPGDRYTGSNAWKHERYDNQPTHYLWASSLLSGANPLVEPDKQKTLPTFTYGVVVRGRGIAEELEISRTCGDVMFYRDEINALCDLIEARLPAWPLAPTDWWCSDKWCPAWSDCRGRYMAHDPFGLMAKAAVLTGKNRAVRLEAKDENDRINVDPDPFAGLPTK